MPKEIKTSRIILDGLETIVKLLKELKINYAIMGGLALAVWGRERVTKDIDVVIGIEKDKLKDLVDFLKNVPFSIRSASQHIGESLLIFATYEDKVTGFPIDIDLFIAQTEFQKETLKISPRPIDIVDAEGLIEENKEDIDKAYLRTWAKKLNISGKLKKLLIE